MREPLESLRAAYSWPSQPPNVPADFGPLWYVDSDRGHTGVLKRIVPRETRVIMELGSFVGRSTAAFLRLFPQADVIAIDTWRGSPGFPTHEPIANLLPRMHETFLANLWPHRQRLIPIRADTLTGMRIVKEFGVVPDVVYVDADHETQAVIDDLYCILELFPTAQIVGDDWKRPSVQAGVERVAREVGLSVADCGQVWWLPRGRRRRTSGVSSCSAPAAGGEKIITMTLYRRPKYARRVLEALAECDGVGEHLVLLHVEPGHPEVLHLAREAPLPRCLVVENETRFGCTGNTWSALEHGFLYADYVIHFEDDTVPSRDCLRYFEWAKDRFRDEPQVFTVSSYSRATPDPAHYHAAVRTPWFTPWGWATWSDRWRQMRSHWSRDPESWGLSLNRLRGDRCEIQPCLARTQNIGAEMGAHVPSPEWHRENHYNEFGAWSVTLDAAGPFFELRAPSNPR